MREESGKGVTSHKSGGAWTEFCDTLQMRCGYMRHIVWRKIVPRIVRRKYLLA